MRLSLRSLVYSLALCSLLASAASFVYAQNVTGAITGAVSDPNDEAVAGAAVTVTNKATGGTRKVTTNSEGAYAVENLAPGEYEVKVESQGFKTLTQSLTVVVGATATSNFSLPVGAAGEVVNVTAEAPVLNTTDTVVGSAINQKMVENLPLNGRSFLSIAALEPTVALTYQVNSQNGNPNNFFQVSVAGAPQGMTHISFDGARVNDRQTGGTSQNFSAESVQEFQISTLGFDLSSGTISAGAVNIVSRSGGNAFHGGALLFFRDHNMSAFTGFKRPTERRPTGQTINPLCNNPASDGCQDALDPFFVRRQYGGSLGGPIKKDKLFFFGNYERTDQVGARVTTFGDPLLVGLSHIGKLPSDFHLASARVDYRANERHNGFLRFNLDTSEHITGTGMESTYQHSSTFAYQTQIGVTSVLKPTLVNDARLSFSYFRNRLRPPTQAECETLADPQYCFGVGGPLITFFGGLTVGTNPNVAQDRHPRTIQFTDNVNWTKGNHRIRFGGNWEILWTFGTWVRNGAGSFTAFSPAAVAAQNRTLYDALPASLRVAGGAPSFQDLLKLPMTGTLSIGIGDPTYPAPWRRDDWTYNHHLRFYARDAWQMFRGFTLNYGLGWSFESNALYKGLTLPEYLRPLIGDDLRGPGYDLNNFDPALGFAWALGKDQKTVVRASSSLHHASQVSWGFVAFNQLSLFGPAGNGFQALSGAVLPNPKVPGQALNIASLIGATPSTVFTIGDMVNYLPEARSRLNALIAAVGNGQDLRFRGVDISKQVAGAGNLDAIFNRDSQATPYTFHLNVGVQREIIRNLSVSADYLMRRAVKFGAFDLVYPDLNRWNRFTNFVRNPVIPACTPAQNALLGTDPVAFASARCSSGLIQDGSPGLLSRYSAFQLKVDKRFSAGFQMTAGYSMSRYTVFNFFSNWDNLHEGIGLSNNPKHRFTASAVWELPKYKGGRFLQGLLNGWQLSTIMEMASAPRRSVTLGVLDREGDGTFVALLPGSGISSFGSNLKAADIRRLVEQYNSTVPAPRDTPVSQIPMTLGQRDAVRTALPYIVLPENFSSGDSFLSHDLRVTRAIRLGEKLQLRLIAEGFNIFNIANLVGYSGALDAYVRPAAVGGTATLPPAGFNFGQPTNRVNTVFGTGGPRAFQLAARLSF